MRLFELRLYLPYLKAYAIPTNYFLLKKNRKNRTIIFFVFAATVHLYSIKKYNLFRAVAALL